MNLKKKVKKIHKVDGERVVKVSAQTVVYAFLILFVFLVGVGSVLAYGTNTQIGAKIAAKISKVVPFPAAIVNWNHIVYLSSLDANLNSVEQLYETKKFSDEGLRVDFTTEIGKKRLEIKKREILDKMVEDQIIMMLAKEKGIEISQAQVDEAVNNQLNEYGTSEDVKKDLKSSYGWEIEDFKKQVVLPNMYAQALADKINAQQKGNNASAKAKIEKAQAELKNGKSFEDTVSQYSEGSSKDTKGELGWVKKDQMIKELADVVFSARVEKNAIIESPIGYHIIEIEEKKKEGDSDVVKLRQIFVSKNTFADWLEAQKKQMNIWVPMNEFTWNKSIGSVKFRDSQMNIFEDEQRSKAQGDASLMF